MKRLLSMTIKHSTRTKNERDGDCYTRAAYNDDDTGSARAPHSFVHECKPRDETTRPCDLYSGNFLFKPAFDGTTVAYSYTPDGKPLRTTKPSGAWTENIYDATRQTVGVVSSDGASDASIQRDEFGRVVAESNAVAMTECALHDFWGATNEVQKVDGVSVSFIREFDAYGRLARFARVCGEESLFAYAPHGAISIVSNNNVAAAYAFTSDALDAGYALAV